MAASNRPPGTQLFIDEEYVTDLEESLEERNELVERWKTCLGGATDFLEIVYGHFEDFDKLAKHFNEADNGVEIVVTPDEEIKFRLNGSEESRSNN